MRVDRNFQNHSNNLKYMINVGRPSYFEEEDFKNWAPFFDYVEECDISIGVNGVYHNMKQMCEDKQGYGGGGFQFCFFFASKEDRKQFLSDLENKLGWQPYRHYDKVGFFTNLEKTTFLYMVPELLEHAFKYLRAKDITFEHVEPKDSTYRDRDLIKVDPSDFTWLIKLDAHLNEILLDIEFTEEQLEKLDEDIGKDL